MEVDKLQSGPGWLNTKALNPALERWVEWEIKNPANLWARMIQAEYILEKARNVVRKNCGYDVERDRVEYHTDLGEVARHLTDEKAMALMTLGETLWQVKARILHEAEMASQKFNVSLEGWHGDDNDGWGPPRWVFIHMREDKWCPRAIRLLEGQLRSNATLLLQAYYAYKGAKRMIDRHTECTNDKCEARTLNDRNEYSPLCVPGCPNEHDPHGCEMVGPDMDEVRRILVAESSSQYVSEIPVLRFRNPDYENQGVKLEVTALPKEGHAPFATVSHVWSDGWGNEKENTLHTCQLQFIRRQLQRLNRGEDVLFWMDTLLVPVKEDQMSDQEKAIKKKAIRQIFDVFQHSTCTIVLDDGLCERDPSRDTQTKTAMMILASGWMRRLWTLQEAFLSSDLHFAFKERNHDLNYNQHLISFEKLNERLPPSQKIQNVATLKYPFIGTVGGMLDRNIMGQERKEKHSPHNNGQMHPRKAAFLVASAWVAARWRVRAYVQALKFED